MRRLVPSLALAIKCASLARIAGTLVEVYLGRDAGQRVLKGRISRGVAERIHAVLWYSDLRGYTSITDTAPPGEIIPLLNDYADAVISAIQETGGEVLKLIGDGVLAIFRADDPAQACRRALQAETGLRHRQQALNARRAADGGPSRQSTSACISAMCSTATSAASIVWTSRSSAPPLTRPAASPRCAGRSTAAWCCHPNS